MLINISEHFIEAGREWQVGQNPDVPREVADRWISEGKATTDTDGARDQSPVSGALPTTYSELGSASAAGAGAARFVSDVGEGTVLLSNGTDWLPVGPMFIGFSTTKITGISSASRQQIYLSQAIPRALLKSLRHFNLSGTVSKSGSTDACEIQLRIGNTGTASDVLIQQITAGAFTAPYRQYSFGCILKYKKATDTIYSLINQAGGFETLTPSTAVYPTSETLTISDAPVYVSVYAVMSGTTDIPACERFQIIGY